MEKSQKNDVGCSVYFKQLDVVKDKSSKCMSLNLFKVVNLPYWPRGRLFILVFHFFPPTQYTGFFDTKSPIKDNRVSCSDWSV